MPIVQVPSFLCRIEACSLKSGNGSREDRKMKTLLLTLVVVTIVCLDLGYTKKCLTKYSPGRETSQTCLAGQNICFKKWKKGGKTSRGCAVTCPKPKKDETIKCCTNNNCNR